MIFIDVIKKLDGLFYPKSKPDERLLQHCCNEDFIAITQETLDKAVYIAAAHEWRIRISLDY
jgi:hypothetical protein